MTKEEFIDYYTGNSDLNKYKTKEGYYIPGRIPRIAVPCNCGEAICVGWVMIPDEPGALEEHFRRCGQPTPT